ncbi:MAG: hypothetical protein WB341_18405, partial [Terracidiphilus sp.]
MIPRHLAKMALLLFMAFAPAAIVSQVGNPSAPAHQAAPLPPVPGAATKPAPGAAAQSVPSTAPSTGQPATQPGAASPGASPANCQGGACEPDQPHITIATPAPAPAPWPLQERISWAANLVLVLIAYVGIMLALSLLRKIERQTRYGETAAQAAADSAKAALMFAEAQAQAQRPWIVVSVETEPGPDNTFTVVATNRGRSPTRIITLVDDIVIVPDETDLPPVPAFKSEPHPPRVPVILLPGEATGLKLFLRDDVKAVCPTAVDLRRLEAWEQKIFLYGNVTYVDIRAPEGKQPFETAWCCWYIHGHQKSGMIVAGPLEYNRHT